MSKSNFWKRFLEFFAAIWCRFVANLLGSTMLRDGTSPRVSRMCSRFKRLLDGLLTAELAGELQKETVGEKNFLSSPAKLTIVMSGERGCEFILKRKGKTIQIGNEGRNEEKRERTYKSGADLIRFTRLRHLRKNSHLIRLSGKSRKISLIDPSLYSRIRCPSCESVWKAPHKFQQKLSKAANIAHRLAVNGTQKAAGSWSYHS